MPRVPVAQPPIRIHNRRTGQMVPAASRSPLPSARVVRDESGRIATMEHPTGRAWVFRQSLAGRAPEAPLHTVRHEPTRDLHYSEDRVILPALLATGESCVNGLMRAGPACERQRVTASASPPDLLRWVIKDVHGYLHFLPDHRVVVDAVGRGFLLLDTPPDPVRFPYVDVDGAQHVDGSGRPQSLPRPVPTGHYAVERNSGGHGWAYASGAACTASDLFDYGGGQVLTRIPPPDLTGLVECDQWPLDGSPLDTDLVTRAIPYRRAAPGPTAILGRVRQDGQSVWVTAGALFGPPLTRVPLEHGFGIPENPSTLAGVDAQELTFRVRTTRRRVRQGVARNTGDEFWAWSVEAALPACIGHLRLAREVPGGPPEYAGLREGQRQCPCLACEHTRLTVEQAYRHRVAREASLPPGHRWCEACGRTSAPRSQMMGVNVRGGGPLLQHWCGACVTALSLVCRDCNRRVDRAQSVNSPATRGVTLCHDCGRRERARVQYANQPAPVIDSYHGSYRLAMTAPIHSPWTRAHGSRFFGVELEVEMGPRGDRETVAREVQALANASERELFVETDSSLSNGIEFISQPMGLDRHRELWARVLNAPIARQMRSHDTSTCGLHVHVARTGLTALQIAKAVVAINSSGEWERLVKTVARRYDIRYSTKKSVTGKVNRRETRSGGKYEFINTGPERTIEFRIFRGSLRVGTVLGCIEFAHALLEFCREQSANQLTVPAFLQWLILPANQADTTNLRALLWRRGAELIADASAARLPGGEYPMVRDPRPDAHRYPMLNPKRLPAATLSDLNEPEL